MTRRRMFIFALVTLLALLTAIPAGAASWAEKLTGGGQATAGGTDFSITASASEDDSGNATGNFEYSRYDGTLSMHGKVECYEQYDDSDVAVVAGYVTVQEGDTSWDGDWVAVGVNEGGTGSGDTVRVWRSTPGTCPPPGSFPGYVWDGNFTIRSK